MHHCHTSECLRSLCSNHSLSPHSSYSAVGNGNLFLITRDWEIENKLYATMNLWLKVGWDHNMASGATHHIHGGNKLQSPSGSAAHKAEAAVAQLCCWQQPRSCHSVEKWLSPHRNDWFIHPIRRESNVPGGRQAQLSKCWSFCCIRSWTEARDKCIWDGFCDPPVQSIGFYTEAIYLCILDPFH